MIIFSFKRELTHWDFYNEVIWIIFDLRIYYFVGKFSLTNVSDFYLARKFLKINN